MERMVILADGPVLTKSDLPARLLQDVESRFPTTHPRPQSAPHAGALAAGPQASSQGDPPSQPNQGAPLGQAAPLAQRDGGQKDPDYGASDFADQDKTDDDSRGPDFSNISKVLNPYNVDEPDSQIFALDENIPSGHLVEVKLDPELATLVEPILRFPESGVDLSSVINRFEDRLIRSALKANNGVKNHAAKALGLNRTTFLEKLKKKGIE
jgi:transcriptional regulator of acetoin/glycerol metabolism